MLILLSPAKTLDYESPLPTGRSSKPEFLDTSETLVRQMKKLKARDLQDIMGVSEKIAELNVQRFKEWKQPFTKENARQAIFAFKGDVYQGLEAGELTADDIKFAQKHLRILSGLYGLLKPLDLIQPYRLEMGTSYSFKGDKNLYNIWGEQITTKINAELRKDKNELVINLASNEYFNAIDKKLLEGTVVSPVFKDEKNGKYKIISFYAKKARGLMAAWIIQKRITSQAGLKKFNVAGYKYSKELSSDNEPVFLRKEQNAG